VVVTAFDNAPALHLSSSTQRASLQGGGTTAETSAGTRTESLSMLRRSRFCAVGGEFYEVYFCDIQIGEFDVEALRFGRMHVLPRTWRAHRAQLRVASRSTSNQMEAGAREPGTATLLTRLGAKRTLQVFSKASGHQGHRRQMP
jgi:hypothetical protein